MKLKTQTGLNPVQLHILQMFKYTKSKKSLEELKDFLSRYYSQKADDEMDKIWEEKKLSQSKLKKMSKEHFRIKNKKEICNPNAASVFRLLVDKILAAFGLFGICLRILLSEIVCIKIYFMQT